MLTKAEFLLEYWDILSQFKTITPVSHDPPDIYYADLVVRILSF